jgi:hypothetical protein
MNDLTPNEYLTMLRSDFFAFIERSFYELNPDAKFLRNWHIEVIALNLNGAFAARRSGSSSTYPRER